MKYATGRYVGFIDSDDWIDSDMYEKLVDKIDSEVEMVVSGQYIEKAGVTSLIIDPIPPGKYATREKLTKIYENLFYFENTINNTISVSLCNKPVSYTHLDKLYSLKNLKYTNEQCSIFNDFFLFEDLVPGKIKLVRH